MNYGLQINIKQFLILRKIRGRNETSVQKNLVEGIICDSINQTVQKIFAIKNDFWFSQAKFSFCLL